MDNPGKQCVICGYIDWDETGFDAIRRETYEETGIDLNCLNDDVVYISDQPYFVKTDPGENRQNVTLNCVFEYDFGIAGHQCVTDSEKFKLKLIKLIRELGKTVETSTPEKVFIANIDWVKLPPGKL